MNEKERTKKAEEEKKRNKARIKKSFPFIYEPERRQRLSSFLRKSIFCLLCLLLPVLCVCHRAFLTMNEMKEKERIMCWL